MTINSKPGSLMAITKGAGGKPFSNGGMLRCRIYLREGTERVCISGGFYRYADEVESYEG